jgi:hypothetical protein
LDYRGEPVQVTNEVVRLELCPSVASDSLHQERTFTNGPVTIRTSFYWPAEPTGPIAGYTAPLIQWDATTITGLTTEPIVLTGFYSQTYRPGHHNFTEEFIFEPRLEQGLSPGLVAELNAQNIQLLHVVWGQRDAPLRILGLDGKFRLISSSNQGGGPAQGAGL